MPSKYHNKKTEIDGHTFDSLMEGERYRQLSLLLYGGYISKLEVHPRYPLVVNGVNCGYYEADFRYIENGVSITEDLKGFRTAVFILKKKLVLALHGVEIKEVDKDGNPRKGKRRNNPKAHAR